MVDTIQIHSSGSGFVPPRRETAGAAGGGFSGWVRQILVLLLALVVAYGIYFWEFRRIVVNPNQVLVLLKKNGSRSLGGDNIIIPRPPDPTDPQYATHLQDWQKTYGDCNGILEQVYPEGTYFGFSPFDYERTVISIEQSAIVPAGKVGIVIKKFGTPLDVDSNGNNVQILADRPSSKKNCRTCAPARASR